MAEPVQNDRRIKPEDVPKGYISKDYILFLLNYYGNMLTWSKEDILSEIKRHIENE